MSTINAASTSQVRYAATLALRIGKVVPLSSVTQPTLSAEGFQAFKRQFARERSAAIVAFASAAPAPHQLRLIAAMAAVSGVTVGQPNTRLEADEWAIAWFRKNSAYVFQVINRLAAPAKPEQLTLFAA